MREIVFQDWITVTGNTTGITSPLPITMALPNMGDLEDTDAASIAVEIADSVGGGVFQLALAVSTGGPYVPATVVDTTNVPGRFVYNIQITAGLVTISSPTNPAADIKAYGRFLMWLIRPPASTAEWSFTFRILITPRGRFRFGTAAEGIAPYPDLQEIVSISGDGPTHPYIAMLPSLWPRTANLSRFVADVMLLFAENASVHIETSSSGSPADFVTAGALTTLGKTSYLFTRDLGATQATMLRNFLKWEIIATNPANPWRICMRITGSAS